jgi:hypothetical protein
MQKVLEIFYGTLNIRSWQSGGYVHILFLSYIGKHGSYGNKNVCDN